MTISWQFNDKTYSFLADIQPPKIVKLLRIQPLSYSSTITKRPLRKWHAPSRPEWNRRGTHIFDRGFCGKQLLQPSMSNPFLQIINPPVHDNLYCLHQRFSERPLLTDEKKRVRSDEETSHRISNPFADQQPDKYFPNNKFSCQGFFSHEIKTDYLINFDNQLIRKPESAKPHRI